MKIDFTTKIEFTPEQKSSIMYYLRRMRDEKIDTYFATRILGVFVGDVTAQQIEQEAYTITDIAIGNIKL